MSLYYPLTVLVGNDTNFYFDITFNGAILPLTLYTPKVIQKATAAALDSSGTTYGVGTGLTVVSAPLGQLKLTIPHANVGSPGVQWWRMDLVDGASDVFTVFYGPLTIKAV
jgi:hypothetical protein